MNRDITLFNQMITDALIKNKRFLLKRPAYLPAFAKISARMKKQAQIRESFSANENLVVPPVLILSVTGDCNLNCKGCYAKTQARDQKSELDIAEIDRVISEAVELGVAIVLIAGGEPLMKKGILDVMKRHPDTLFALFTNGLLLSAAEEDLTLNVVPVISIEGGKATTDQRRGGGIYQAVTTVMERFDKNGRLFGASVTLTRENFDEVIHSRYLDELESKGCRAAFLIEYVPADDDFSLCLTDAQKSELRAIEDALYHKHTMLVVTLPGDEDRYGGCLASGRGFVHISATGSLEACPFAPYSDTNVKNRPLKDALKSALLKQIRDNHYMLKESRGGCALIENKEWIESLRSGSSDPS